MNNTKLCPECGKPLRPGWRRWQCDTAGCSVQYIILNKDGSIKTMVYSGVENIGKV